MALDLAEIHQQMLDGIGERYQKTTGFLDSDIAVAEEKLDLENLSGTELDTFIRQHRGLSRKYATYATATLRVVTGGGDIQAGNLFSTASGVEFYAIQDGTYTAGDTFSVRAYVGGESGNVGPNTITYMPVTIAGIGAVTNDEAATGGYDAESDEEFRARYYNDLQNPNNGSNQQAYIAWAMSVPGVGRVRIFPQALGANTVEVCLVDPNMEPAGSEVIQAVQALIDPNKNGDGSGEAPIGAVCTVTTAERLEIAVSASVTIAEEAELGAVTEAVKANLTDYLREIAFAKGVSYVSYAQIAAAILSEEGVLDHKDLTVNGGTSNVPLEDRQTPVLGEVHLT